MIIICITAALEADSTRQERVKKLVRESLFNLENETNSLVKARNSIENIEKRRKIVEENGIGKQHDSKRLLHMMSAPEDLAVDLNRYAELIQERLKVTGEPRGLQGVLDKYSSLNWVLKTMLAENGDYWFEYENIIGDSKTLSDIDFDYETQINLDHLSQFILRRTKKLKSWYWLDKTQDGHYRSVLLYFRLWDALYKEVLRASQLLESARHRPTEPIASIDDILKDYRTNDDSLPSFNLDIPDNVEFCYTHETMIKGKYFGEDVSEKAWKYVVTGEGEAPTEKLNWTGKLNELAKMAELFNNEKKVVGGYLALVARIFKVKGKDTDRKKLANTSKLSSKDEKRLKRALQDLIGRHNQ